MLSPLALSPSVMGTVGISWLVLVSETLLFLTASDVTSLCEIVSDFSNTIWVVKSGLGIVMFLTVISMLDMTKAWKTFRFNTLFPAPQIVFDAFQILPFLFLLCCEIPRSCVNALLQLVFGWKLVWPLGSCHLTRWQILQCRGSFATHEILCLLFISQVLVMNAFPTEEMS